MMKKYGLVTPVSFTPPFSYTSAAPAMGAVPAADDTIVVDRSELMEVLRGVAASEMRNQYRPKRNVERQ